MKTLCITTGLIALVLPATSFAIDPSYQDQISCKNWRLQLNEVMQFLSHELSMWKHRHLKPQSPFTFSLMLFVIVWLQNWD